jgi:EmrB/QacA subfamily drug resistance transporter
MALSLEKFGLSQKTLMINLVMLVGAFIAILNQTLLTPALPSIMADMNIGASTAQWLTTGFMLVNGIMIPVTAYLIDRFTTRKLFFVSMGIFTLGTALAAVSTTFPMILAARLLQAAGAGVMMPMGQTILLLTLPRQYRGLGMGIIGLVIGVAPAVGPVISGLVVESFGWHILFKAMVPLALLTIVFAYFFLENMGETSHITLDMPSVILSTLGFGGLLYSFSALGSYGFNSMVAITLLIGVISLIMFVHRQLHMEQPLLKMDILKNHRFALSVVLTMLVQAALNVGVVLNPIYIQTIRGFGASVSGFLMLPASIAMLIMSPISGRLFDKFGPRRLAIPGLFLTSVFTIPMVLMDENTSLYYLAFVYTIRTIGLSMVNMPLNTWGLNSLDNRVMAHGTAIGNTFRQVAGSLGCAILITVMSIVVANCADPATIASQIHGINVAYMGATLMMTTAFVLTILFVKEER